MAVIVANVYQQAAMCVTEKHRAPKWLIKFALIYMSPLLHLQDKVKAVMSQTVREYRRLPFFVVFLYFVFTRLMKTKVHPFDWMFSYENMNEH